MEPSLSTFSLSPRTDVGWTEPRVKATAPLWAGPVAFGSHGDAVSATSANPDLTVSKQKT